LLCWDCHWHGS